MHQPGARHPDLTERRLTPRRGVLLVAALVAVSVVVVRHRRPCTCGRSSSSRCPRRRVLLRARQPRRDRAGSATSSSLYYSFAAARRRPEIVRQALLGTALFFIAGLVLGRVQRAHRQRAARAGGLDAHRPAHRPLQLRHLRRLPAQRGHQGRPLRRRALPCSCSTSTTSSSSTTATATRPATTCCAASAPTMRLAGARRRHGGALRRRGVRAADPRRRAHGYELAERLRRAVETITVEVRGGEQVFVTVSAGVATYPPGPADEARAHRARGRRALRVQAARPQPGVAIFTRRDRTSGRLPASLIRADADERAAAPAARGPRIRPYSFSFSGTITCGSRVSGAREHLAAEQLHADRARSALSCFASRTPVAMSCAPMRAAKRTQQLHDLDQGGSDAGARREHGVGTGSRAGPRR